MTEPVVNSDFERLARAPRLSDKVAEVILQTILSKNLRPGDRLPSQRELGDQFGVSRTVVREAVRSLVAKGIVAVRSGSGLRVAATDAASVSESMTLYLRGIGPLALNKVWEVRKMLEIHLVGVSAERATEMDIATLGRLCDRYGEALDAVGPDGNLDDVAKLDVDFHRAIAETTHNELYLVALDAIADQLMEIRRIAVRFRNPASARGALTFHRQIVEKIAERDVQGARDVMQAHLDEVERTWQSVRETSGGRILSAAGG